MTQDSQGRAFQIDVDGDRIAVAWFGLQKTQPAQPVIVMLHEGLGSIAMWEDFPVALAQATGVPVFAYERQGHGASGRPKLPRVRNWMHDEALRVLPAVLADQGIVNPLLFSHSDGATIALIHAGHYPVRGVVSEAAHVFHDDMMISGARRATRQWARGVLRDFLKTHHGDNAEMLLTGWLDWWRQSRPRGWQIIEDMKEITSPVLAIQGTKDAYGTPDQVHRIVETVAGPSESLFLDGCGHIPHHEARGVVMENVLIWINKHRLFDG